MLDHVSIRPHIYIISPTLVYLRLLLYLHIGHNTAVPSHWAVSPELLHLLAADLVRGADLLRMVAGRQGGHREGVRLWEIFLGEALLQLSSNL